MKKILLVLLILFMPIITFAEDEEKSQINTYLELAETYVGKSGDCYWVATQFLKDLYDDKNFTINLSKKYEEVDYEDAVPGDVIFYEWMKSRVGTTTHWAVYLDKDLAFQGNWGGKVKIDKIFLDFGAKPKFYHLKEVEAVEVDFSPISLNISEEDLIV